jgi:hypothetical protein
MEDKVVGKWWIEWIEWRETDNKVVDRVVDKRRMARCCIHMRNYLAKSSLSVDD